ncbi:pAG1 [Santa barbara virus]|uniref:PAG1 n=1 Tax=Santa barbara virus TaxID=1552661 RepID=A0A097A5B4_9RHAB|nr:pAG1 [Santa barbara virus]AIS40845.1 pAG1 [Santa barbara virus]
MAPILPFHVDLTAHDASSAQLIADQIHFLIGFINDLNTPLRLVGIVKQGYWIKIYALPDQLNKFMMDLVNPLIFGPNSGLI